MEPTKAKSIIAFYNVFAEELGIEDATTLRELRQMIPIIVAFIKKNTLEFVCNTSFGFASAVEFLRCDGLDDGLYSHLNTAAAEEEDDLEMAKILVALMYKLRLVRQQEFTSYCDKLKPDEKVQVAEIMGGLYEDQKPDWSQSLSPLRQGVPTESLLSEESVMYKNKATELEAKVKQIELTNHSLNEQLAQAHSELSELEKKHEQLNNSSARKQNSFEELQKKVKDIQDESEELRYNNSQLKRELKNTKDLLTRTTEKFTADIKLKDNEMALMSRRQDHFIEQLAEKESIESRVKFLDQQAINSQGIQSELKDELEKAISRANSAETELSSLKKLLKANATLKEEEAANTSSVESVRSLHEELNFSMKMNGSLESSQMMDEEFAELKTKVEVLEKENKFLKKMNEDVRKELNDSRTCDSKTVLEKSIEIERLRQECESLREELGKTRQRELSAVDKSKQLEGKSIELTSQIKKLEESLDKAKKVIDAYSTTSEGHESSAELLSLRSEFDRLQTENQRLVAKMDQFRHEATQEQRLITTHWYMTQLDNFQLQHGLGTTSNSKVNTDRNSGNSTASQKSPASSQNHHESKSAHLGPNCVKVEAPATRYRSIIRAVLLFLLFLSFFGSILALQATNWDVDNATSKAVAQFLQFYTLFFDHNFFFDTYNEPPR